MNGAAWFKRQIGTVRIRVRHTLISCNNVHTRMCLYLITEAKKVNAHMDTDDLSKETYRAIMIEAEKFNHDLTLQFGLRSDDCDDEQEFIDQSKQLINELKVADLSDLEDIFIGNVPNLTKLNKALDKILYNISKIKYNGGKKP